MLAHLPILQVIVPLMAAPLCLLLGRPRLVWLFSLIASGSAFIISALLLQQVMASGTIVYGLKKVPYYPMSLGGTSKVNTS